VTVEKKLRAELRRMPSEVAGSALAEAAVGLAKALDAGPGDDARVRLVRELRLTTAELHRRSGDDVGSELEGFLAGIASPTFRVPGN
jgi:hypothetical protein